MPITGGTPAECFDTFKKHVAGLVAETLQTGAIVLCPRPSKGQDQTRRVLSLGPANHRSVPLDSASHGKVHVYLSQNLEARAEERKYRLLTQEYRYSLFDREPSLTDEPLFRWEYVSVPEAGGKWCRHHFHVGKVMGGHPRDSIKLPVGKSSVDLNHLHIPTGFTLIEHVIRFLINDLGVHAKDGWEAALERSEDRFFREFSSKTSAP